MMSFFAAASWSDKSYREYVDAISRRNYDVVEATVRKILQEELVLLSQIHFKKSRISEDYLLSFLEVRWNSSADKVYNPRLFHELNDYVIMCNRKRQNQNSVSAFGLIYLVAVLDLLGDVAETLNRKQDVEYWELAFLRGIGPYMACAMILIKEQEYHHIMIPSIIRGIPASMILLNLANEFCVNFKTLISTYDFVDILKIHDLRDVVIEADEAFFCWKPTVYSEYPVTSLVRDDVQIPESIRRKFRSRGGVKAKCSSF